MRSMMFLASIVCALVAAAFAGEVVQAKCRCNASSRRAAKCERKAYRRGYVFTDNRQPTTDNSYYNPYGGDAITPTAGAAVETEVKWVCNGRSCYPVRVPVVRPVAPPAPQPDPAFKDVAPIQAKPQTPPSTQSVFPPGVINGT